MPLHEEHVADCLRGKRTISQLEPEVMSAVERVSSNRERVRIADMSDEFVVTRDMLVRLCDAASASEISPGAVRILAFAIVASEQFMWNDDVVGEVLHDWAAPEVNLTLSPENLQRFRKWLMGDESYPAKTSTLGPKTEALGGIISELEKVTVRPTASRDDIVARVCTFPQRLYRSGRPAHELARETGFALHRHAMTVRAIRRWLRAHPDAIEWWQRWSEDKRTTSGWYFVRGTLFSEIGWYEASRGKQHVQRFISPSAACAHFVIREMGDLARPS